MFERTALPDGPRVITACLPGARSVAIAAYVLGGSRHERVGQVGAAHFLEHLTFKGTAAYPTGRLVSEAVEGVGGSFNAATDRESTIYWVRVPRREARRGMEVLGELICRPALDPVDIDRERGIIVEEIRSYLDDPAEHAQILFQQAMFGDGPLGREVCGDAAAVSSMPARAIRDFWEAAYQPANVVVSVAGDLAHEEALALAAAAFDRGAAQPITIEPAPSLPAGPRLLVGRQRTGQVQLVVGVPALPRDHPDAWTLAMLNAILGEGTSSRLFLAVREELGLAYDVGSGLTEYADAGALEVSAGVDPDRLGPALDAILAELARLRDQPVPDDELERSKAWLSGGLELRLEETRHLASWIGGQEALHDRVLTLDEALAEIRAVQSIGIQQLATKLFANESLRMSMVGAAQHARVAARHLRLPT